VDNALNFESSQAYQKTTIARARPPRVLLEINNVLVTSREFPELSVASSPPRARHSSRYTSLALLDPATGLLRIHALDFPGNQDIFKPKRPYRVTTRPPAGHRHQPTAGRTRLRADRYSPKSSVSPAEGLQAVCCTPADPPRPHLGTLNLASRPSRRFPSPTMSRFSSRSLRKSPSPWKTHWRSGERRAQNSLRSRSSTGGRNSQ